MKATTTTPKTRASSKAAPLSSTQVGLKHGFRSGLEERIAAALQDKSVAYSYEALKVPFVEPAKPRKYSPDFVLLINGIVVESKGRFITEDRQKQLLVKQQHPDLDLRFVFSNSRAKISKRSLTTYADWCEKHGFLYADKDIPDSWLKEPPNLKSLEAIERLQGT